MGVTISKAPMFWNQDREIDVALGCRNSGKTVEQAAIRFDDGWAQVAALSDADVLQMKPDDIASFSGMGVEKLNEVIEGSLREWRQNPARSFINIVSNLPAPVAGELMFDDLLKQTLVLTGLKRAAAETQARMGSVSSPTERGKLHKVQSGGTLTMRSDHEGWLNGLARSMRVWEMRNGALVRSGQVKPPKRLFRGVRSGDIKLQEKISRDGIPHEQYAAAMTDARLDYLTSTPADQVFFSRVLSFTANQDVAKYFSNGEGFIVGIDPTSVDVVSSFKLDSALDQKDYVSKRHEREWIIRLPPKTIIPRPDVEVWHRDWLMVRGDHRAIDLVDHSARAHYEISGHTVTATMEYNTHGKSVGTRFCVDGDWRLLSRAEVKKRYGFDPLPESADAVSNLGFFHYDRYAWGRHKEERLINVQAQPALAPTR